MVTSMRAQFLHACLASTDNACHSMSLPLVASRHSSSATCSMAIMSSRGTSSSSRISHLFRQENARALQPLVIVTLQQRRFGGLDRLDQPSAVIFDISDRLADPP